MHADMSFKTICCVRGERSVNALCRPVAALGDALHQLRICIVRAAGQGICTGCWCTDACTTLYIHTCVQEEKVGTTVGET